MRGLFGGTLAYLGNFNDNHDNARFLSGNVQMDIPYKGPVKEL